MLELDSVDEDVSSRFSVSGSVAAPLVLEAEKICDMFSCSLTVVMVLETASARSKRRGFDINSSNSFLCTTHSSAKVAVLYVCSDRISKKNSKEPKLLWGI